MLVECGAATAQNRKGLGEVGGLLAAERNRGGGGGGRRRRPPPCGRQEHPRDDGLHQSCVLVTEPAHSPRDVGQFLTLEIVP